MEPCISASGLLGHGLVRAVRYHLVGFERRGAERRARERRQATRRRRRRCLPSRGRVRPRDFGSGAGRGGAGRGGAGRGGVDRNLSLVDVEGVAASAGSACAAGAPEPSHVLRALGYDDARAESVIRLSLGGDADGAGIGAAVERIAAVVGRARGAAA